MRRRQKRAVILQRRAEAFNAVVSGLSNREIAASMGVSERTVSHYVAAAREEYHKQIRRGGKGVAVQDARLTEMWDAGVPRAGGGEGEGTQRGGGGKGV